MEGFLDEERAKLQAAIQDGKWGGKVTVDHPVVQIERVAGLLRRPENSGWYD
jgi:hypothetical protein